MAERAQALRDQAMAQLESDTRSAERFQEHQWRLEEKAAPTAAQLRGGGGGGGRRSGGGSSSKSAPGTQYEILSPEEQASLGLPEEGRYQRNNKTGNITSVAGTSDYTYTPPPSNTPPDVGMSDGPALADPTARGPKVGDVVEGYTFLGGDPNDMNSWEKN
jgi:hypothetical protein